MTANRFFGARARVPIAATATLAALALGSAANVSCSSSSAPAACDPCTDGGSPTALQPSLGHDSNPDGIAYPAPVGGYGHTARRGNTPGNVIQNFKFQGYLNGDKSAGLQTIALADYFDPCGKRSKLLHLSVAALWCVPCNDETNAFVAAKAQLAYEGIVVVQALSDGPQLNVGATPSDLDYWVAKHAVNFTEMLDPALMNFGSFFAAESVPWNADIDPRTMEILDKATGWAGTVDQEVQTGLDSIASPPGYAVTCTK